MRKSKQIVPDIIGGLTSAVVALPLALAFGVASGVSPQAGLYSAIIAGFFATLFGGTPSQITGPTGPMTVVMATIVGFYTCQFGIEQGLAISFTIVVVAGIFQILFGLLRLGEYIQLVPYPVVSAFMTGIGVLIIILQIPSLFGFDASGLPPKEIVQNTYEYATTGDYWALGLGLFTLLLTFVVPKKLPIKVPATLVALIIGSCIAPFLDGYTTLSFIGEIPSGLPSFQMPALDRSDLLTMIEFSLVLAALGSIDSLLTSVIADNLTQTYHKPDAELRGQGIGNILAGLFGGIPAASATMRTVVNIHSGGRGRLSGMVHSILLLLLLLGLGGVVNKIPHVVLSGILLKVGVDIIDWKFLSKIHRITLPKALVVVAVVLLTVFSGLLMAIGVGVVLFSFFTLKHVADAQIEEMENYDRTSIESAKLPKKEKDVIKALNDNFSYFHLTGPMSFGATSQMFRCIVDFGKSKVQVIDLMDVTLVDLASAMILSDIIDKTRNAKRKLILIVPRHLSSCQDLKTTVLERLKKSQIFHDRLKALDYVLELGKHEDTGLSCGKKK